MFVRLGFNFIEVCTMFASREGQKVPNVVFHTRQNNAWVDVTTDDLF